MNAIKKRVFMVDDHPMVREGAAIIINQERDLVLCGAAATASEAIAGIPKAKPDVVIVDLSLAGQSGLDLIKCLRSRYPKLPLVVYTMHENAIYSERARESGANGYVTKTEPPAKLLSALRHAIDGTMTTRHSASARSKAARLPVGRLSERELEVFELRGQGLTREHIAARLHLSGKTVDTYHEHIKRKMGLSKVSELQRAAVEWEKSKRGL